MEVKDIIKRLFPAITVFILLFLLTANSLSAQQVSNQSESSVKPFPDELEAMKKAEANPSKANIEALADIRYRHAIRLMQLSEKNKDKNSLELAVMYAESTTELSTNSAKYWALLGLLYEKLKDNSLAQVMAVEALKKAVLLNPMDYGSMLALGSLYFSAERYSLALDQYEEVVRADAGMLQSPLTAAMCTAYIVDFQYDRGVNFFKKILDKNLHADSARLALAILLKQKQNRIEAEAELQKIIMSAGSANYNRNYALELIREWAKEVPE